MASSFKQNAVVWHEAITVFPIPEVLAPISSHTCGSLSVDNCGRQNNSLPERPTAKASEPGNCFPPWQRTVIIKLRILRWGGLSWIMRGAQYNHMALCKREQAAHSYAGHMERKRWEGSRWGRTGAEAGVVPLWKRVHEPEYVGLWKLENERKWILP